VDRTAVARQHLVEGEERVVEAPQTRQHDGAIVKRIEIAGIEPDQPVASSQRLLEPAEREQRSHQYRQCLWRPRPELDRLAQELVSFTGAALLISDEAEQMQRVELARVAREHGTIDRLRLGDPAHPMQRFSLVDGRHRKANVLAGNRGAPLSTDDTNLRKDRHSMSWVGTDAAERQRSSRRRNLRGRQQRVRKRPGWPEIARARPWRAHEPRPAGGLPARPGADHRRFRHAGAGAFERSRAPAAGPPPPPSPPPPTGRPP